MSIFTQLNEKIKQFLVLDGKEINVPLRWFPKLKEASPKKRKNWRLVGKGIGIHWPDLDEDISVSALLK